jgi:hypothetical protein
MRLTAAEARAIKRCTAAAFGPAAVVRLRRYIYFNHCGRAFDPVVSMY